MHYSPHMCFKDERGMFPQDESLTGDSEGALVKVDMHSPDVVTRNPVNWLVTRLSHIAKNARIGSKCRQVVYKCFASFAVECESEILLSVLEKILSVLLSSSPECESELTNEVLQLLESKLDSAVYMATYTCVETGLRMKRQQRKEKMRIETVVDPKNAAKRKMGKHQRDRCRQKRRLGNK
jgi:hypothetical protein